MLAKLNELRKLVLRIKAAKNVAGFGENNNLAEFMTQVLEILVELEVFNKKAQIDQMTREIRVSHFLKMRSSPKSFVKNLREQTQTCLIQTSPETNCDLFPSKFILPMYTLKPKNQPNPTRF